MPTNPYGPGWPAIGARVAEYDDDGAPVIVTVIRLTNVQIITSGPRRYRRDTLTVIGGHHRQYTLCPLTDPRVVRARALATLKNVATAAAAIARTTRETAEGYAPGGYKRVGPSATTDEVTAATRAALHDIAGEVTAALATLDDTAEHPTATEGA